MTATVVLIAGIVAVAFIRGCNAYLQHAFEEKDELNRQRDADAFPPPR